jgi:prohibitin 1
MMRSLRSFLKRARRMVTLWLVWVLIIGVFLGVVFWRHVVHVTPVGTVSVYWYRFPLARSLTGDSRVAEEAYQTARDSAKGAEVIDLNSVGPLHEGAHFVWPWDKFFTYETRLRKEAVSYEVVSSDGLHYEMTLAFRWKVLDRNVVGLNTHIGPDYVNRLLIPDVGAVARGVVSRYKAEALYTGQRQKIANQIYEYITSTRRANGIGDEKDDGTDGNYISLKDVLITSVKLPPSLRAAIERKLQENERVQEYKWRVEREKLESQRKAVEAEGIANFQRIVAPQITESYLRWRGIEATLSLAESKNSKVVVIGNSETGLPLILDTRTDLGGQVTSEAAASEDSGAAKPGVGTKQSTAEIKKAMEEEFARKAEIVHKARAQEAEAATWVQQQATAAKQESLNQAASQGDSNDQDAANQSRDEASYNGTGSSSSPDSGEQRSEADSAGEVRKESSASGAGG